MYKLLLLVSFFNGYGCATKKAISTGNINPPGTMIVPIGGNSWRTTAGTDGGNISEKGILNWTNEKVGFVTYVRLVKTGTLKLGIHAALPEGQSRISVTVLGKEASITVSGSRMSYYNTGVWEIKDTGYVAINVNGISKTGKLFADIDSIKMSGTAVDAGSSFVKNNEGNFFYWGRRGPSVHLSYALPEDENAAYFYNEITVPEGNDVIGSYYMANGFGEGYFGIQVNSDTERRVLFSVWSPYQTDDPTQIPDAERIQMLRKGAGVHTGEFGNEGAGGQSYLRYPWKAGVTYRFLLKGQPDGTMHTTYTAWFFDPERNNWILIASFRRPKTNTWLKRFHSFLENFDPEKGNITRKVFFTNQWICTDKGQWIELTKARFTGDNTARVGFRKDYAGGISGNNFYLQNCGFFSNNTALDTWFERPALNKKPDIDFEKLP